MKLTDIENLKLPKSRKGRRTKRRKVYLGEFTHVNLEFDKGDFSGDVLDLSPSGIGGVIDKGSFIPERTDRVRVTYGNRDGHEFKVWGVVASCEVFIFRGEQKVRVGILFAAWMDSGQETTNAEAVKRMRVACPEGYHPPAFCEDPFFFHERIHFEVVGFSAKVMRVRVMAFYATLLPNVCLNLTVFLPMLGLYEVAVRIDTIVETGDGDQFFLDLELLGDATQFQNDVSQFLLMSGGVRSVEELRERLFVVNHLERALFFRYANGDDDLAEVERLRGAQFDEFDVFSRQLLCKVSGKTIACARLVFADGDPTRSELEKLVRGIPQSFWVHKFVEASRFHCVPGFSAKDVYVSFLKHFVRITAESGARYLLTACSPIAEIMYEKIGFQRLRPIGARESELVQGMVILYLDVHSLFTDGGVVRPAVFKKYYSDVVKHIGCIPKALQEKEESRTFWTRK
jgi:N-acyl-L-homoserine lactone synthetase